MEAVFFCINTGSLTKEKAIIWQSYVEMIFWKFQNVMINVRKHCNKIKYIIIAIYNNTRKCILNK